MAQDASQLTSERPARAGQLGRAFTYTERTVELTSQDYTRVPYPGQEVAMGCRIWNENLAAYFVTAPLTVKPPTVDAPVATDREDGDGNG